MRCWFCLHAVLLIGCSDGAPAALPDVVARLNDQPIKGRVLMLRALRQYGAVQPANWGPILTRLLDDEIDLRLLAKEAQKRQLKLPEGALDQAVKAVRNRYPAHRYRRALDRLAIRTEDLEARATLRLLAEALIGDEAAKQPVSDEAIAAWQAKHPAPEQVVVRHLLTASESEAKEALRLHQKGRFSFADLVRRFSSAPEAKQGGLLPAFGRGDLPPVFDHAFQLKVGSVSEPLRSEHGWHILRLERLDRGGETPADVARRSIVRTREGALQGQLIARLRGEAQIAKVPGSIHALAQHLATESP